MPKGDCFYTHGNFVVNSKFMNNGTDDTWRIVHGIVINKNDNKPMTHCWLEYRHVIDHPKVDVNVLMCVDKSNDRDVELPAALYYRAGRIETVVRYDFDSYINMLQKHKNYGPWELDCKR